MHHSSKIRRRSFAAVAALMASGAVVPVIRAQPRAEDAKLSIGVGGKTAFHCLPLVLALQLGYFKAEGLDVAITDFPDEASALQALAAGSMDVVSGAYEHTINLQGKGQSIQSIVLQSRVPQIAVGVSSRNLPGLKALTELRGARIGISATGSSTQSVVSTVLLRSGLTGADVTFLAVGMGAGALSALRSGQIDVISNVEPVMTMLEHKGEVRVIADTRTLKGTQEVFGGHMPTGCLCAPIEFVQGHPGTCQALANAMVRALKWLRTAGPGDLFKTVPESYLLGDRGLYLTSFNKVAEAYSLDGMMPEESTRTALRALSALDPGVRADRIDLASTFTNEFARRAKNRFKA